MNKQEKKLHKERVEKLITLLKGMNIEREMR